MKTVLKFFAKRRFSLLQLSSAIIIFPIVQAEMYFAAGVVFFTSLVIVSAVDFLQVKLTTQESET